MRFSLSWTESSPLLISAQSLSSIRSASFSQSMSLSVHFTAATASPFTMQSNAFFSSATVSRTTITCPLAPMVTELSFLFPNQSRIPLSLKAYRLRQSFLGSFEHLCHTLVENYGDRFPDLGRVQIV